MRPTLKYIIQFLFFLKIDIEMDGDIFTSKGLYIDKVVNTDRLLWMK